MTSPRDPKPRPPHPATVVQQRSPERAPHPATVVQQKTAVGPPPRSAHPATVAQKKEEVDPGQRPPHPATVVQKKAAVGPAPRSPHPATVAGPPASDAIQRMKKKPKPKTLSLAEFHQAPALPAAAPAPVKPVWSKLPASVTTSNVTLPQTTTPASGSAAAPAPKTGSAKVISALETQWNDYWSGGAGALGSSTKSKKIYVLSATLTANQLASVVSWWLAAGGTVQGPHFYLETTQAHLNANGPHVNFNSQGFAGHLYLTGLTVLNADYTRAVNQPHLMNHD